MKAVGYQKSLAIENPDSLIDIELEAPKPTGHDLLVEIEAISVNPVDTKIRKRTEPPAGDYKVLGWDAVGQVTAVGEQVSLFKPGDRVWYAGAIDRPGTNAQYHLVDERIVGRCPANLSAAQAAAMPLTSITAWEMLFDRLALKRNGSNKGATLLVIGAAGGVGSILVQLAKALTDAVVIGTAARDKSITWVKRLGAHHVIDHSNNLSEEIKQVGLDCVSHIAAITRSDLHFDEMVELIKPFGQIAMIDDPGDIAIGKLKTKSVSFHWELMFTRSLFHTEDMIEQHRLLNEVAQMVEQGQIQTTLSQNFGVINAENLRRAHALIESGKSRGKIVLEGF